jgi:hypothetical protein
LRQFQVAVEAVVLQQVAVLPEVSCDGVSIHNIFIFLRDSVSHISKNHRKRKRRSRKMLQITDTAREKFKELMKEHTGKFLRVVFEGFG